MGLFDRFLKRYRSQVTRKEFLRQVRFFEVSCRDCDRKFGIPLLGDFASCGEFILQGERGDVFGYLSAYEDPWEDLETRIRRVSGIRKMTAYSDTSRMHKVIAACADPICGQNLVHTTICPSCHSDRICVGDSTPLQIAEIRYVTFENFGALSERAKMEKVRQLWDRFSQDQRS